MTDVQLTYDQKPGLAAAMVKALLLPRKGFNQHRGLPDIRGSWMVAQADPTALKNYHNVLGLSQGEYLPILYPHVLAGGLHMNMLTHKLFPFGLLGAVHLKNRITQHEPIKNTQVMDIHSAMGEFRLLAKGLEFDFSTQVMVEGEKVWEEVSTYFMAGKFGGKENPSSQTSFELATLENTKNLASWPVPKDRGKKYAKISGDYNPIHMSATLAKLFGLKRDIAHGFGIVAEAIHYSGALTALENAGLSDKKIQVDVVFKGPVFLESQAVLKQNQSQDKNRFDVYCGENPKPSICCAVIAL
ncbi:MAG: MaoC/PaaZ C-terminal domain-containing protein [Bermanella sp.]